MLAETFGIRTWEAPEVSGLNRLPMRRTTYPFPDQDDARTDDRAESPWFLSLDGRWRFRLAARPEDVTRTDVARDTDDDGWDEITVPGVWTMQGWDRPHYTNVVMPFDGDPPSVPDENPTGVHRTSFRLPRDWAGRRVVLHVGGAESVLHVFCNGDPVGMSKDSRLPAEFDLTSHLRQRGLNSLVLVVVRWSDATWLEDQDHWFHGGIHREVFLYSTASTFLADVQTSATLLDDLSTGELTTVVRVGADDALEEGWSVELELETLAGREVFNRARSADVPVFERDDRVSELVSAHVHRGPVVGLRATVDDVDPWSAEIPSRYRAVVTLVDPEGEVVESTSVLTGFRRVEIADRKLLVNGEPVWIRGVNRHDHDPDTGKTQNRASLRRDVELMKEHNLNAIRTAHYPNDPHLLELCDELGVYVISEANIETHARMAELCHDPRYEGAFFERFRRMVARDGNHPSVIGWSLGNESGYGAVHDAMAAWSRRVDPTRFVHYEGAHRHRVEGAGPATDVACPMYPSIDAIVAYGEGDDERPLIMCEYSHAMGNSNGSLADYWTAIETTDGLQGGFVWDWADQGLRATTSDGIEFFAYGGHFGDTPNDSTFCLNGLVGPDRHPHPALREYQHLAQPVRIRAKDLRKGMVTVVNRQHFRALDWLSATWFVDVDGVTVSRGVLELPDLGPGEQGDVRFDLERPELGPGQEAYVVFRVEAADDQGWVPDGQEVAWEQARLPWRGEEAEPADPGGPTEVEERTGSSRVRLPDAGVEVDVDGEGQISVAAGGEMLVLDDPAPCLWRAPICNDGETVGESVPLNDRVTQWRDWGLDRLRVETTKTKVVSRRSGATAVSLTRELHGAGGLPPVVFRRTVEILGSGELRFDDRIRVPADYDDLPRVGVRFTAAAGLEEVMWFGRGPDETYTDRRTGSTVGRWTTTVDEQYVPYVRPQEHGNHLDTRWFSLRRADGTGLLVSGMVPTPRMQFSARHHFDDDLEAAQTTAELPRRDEIEVHVDHAHRGVGTGACGPDTLPAYRVGSGTYRWHWRLRVLHPGGDPADLARRP